MSNRQQVCKFFKQGRCQYGNSCRFYHPQQSNNNYNNYGSVASGNNAFGNQTRGGLGAFGNFASNNNTGFSSSGGNTGNAAQETPQQFCDPKSLTKRQNEMRNDMLELDEMLNISNCIFTSYSLKPPAIANAISNRDFSFEEARVQYYQAQATNTIPQYQQQIANRHNDMKNAVNFIKQNSDKAVRYLQLSLSNQSIPPKPLIPVPDFNVPVSATGSGSIFSTSTSSNVSNPFGGQSNPFGSSANLSSGGTFGSSGFGSSTTGAFGNQTSTTGAFGNQTSTTGAFGNQTSVASPFGGSATGKTGLGGGGFGSSGFGSSGFGSSGFGTKTSGAFGSVTLSNLAASAQSPFGSSPASTTSGPFGGTSSATASTFGVTNSANATSSFDTGGFGNAGFGKNLGNAFKEHSENANTFNRSSSTNAQSNPFGGVSTGNAFGNKVFGGVFGAQDNSPFGGNSQGNATEFRQSEIEEPKTRIQDLGDKILELFNADTFELGKVPDIPPPLELC